MCNRYSSSNREAVRELAARLAGPNPINQVDDWNPSYNIASGTAVPVLTAHNEQPFRLLVWGLKGPAGFVVNASSETLNTDALWATAVQYYRCLILADGFYEWSTGDSKVMIGHYFTLSGRDAFAIAALWWPGSAGSAASCVMVTSTANEIIAPFNPRMPSILTDERALEWLGSQPLPKDLISRLCEPYPATEMTEWRSPPELNRKDFDQPAAIKPWQPKSTFFG